MTGENVNVKKTFDKNLGKRPYGVGQGRKGPGRELGPPWAFSPLSRPRKIYFRKFYQKYSARTVTFPPGHSF